MLLHVAEPPHWEVINASAVVVEQKNTFTTPVEIGTAPSAKP